MRYTTLLLCFCSILLLGSCKSQPSAQNGQPLEVMTFNVRLDIPSDSVNNWNYRKGDACRMIAYYSPDLLGMQEVLHNQMEDLKRGLPQYTALGVGRDDGKEAGEYCPIFFRTDRFTLLEYGNFSLSEQPETIGIKGWDASYNRVTTWAILQEKNNGQKFVYFNTHLDNDGKTARKEGCLSVVVQMGVEIYKLLSVVLFLQYRPVKNLCKRWKREEWKMPQRQLPSPTVRPGLSMTSAVCRWRNAYCWTMSS